MYRYLDGDMKRLAEEVAAMVAELPDRKLRRVAFEKYVTHCLAERRHSDKKRAAAEDLEDPFVAMKGGGAAMPHAIEDTPEALLAQRDALLHDVRASRPAAAKMDDEALLRALRAEDDPRFYQLLELTLRANRALQVVAAPTWSGWPRGAWASACDGKVLGPFGTRDEARVSIDTLPRSFFGALSWQVGIPPVPLYI